MDPQELLLTAGRAAFIYVFMLVVIRLLGKRTVGSFTAFDLLVALMLGEIVDEPIFGDVPVVQALVAITALAIVHFANEYLSYRSLTFDRIAGGSPSVLIENGRMDRRAMALERVNEEELRAMLRQQQVENLDEVKRGTLETSGTLSVIKTEDAQELRKGDLPERARQGA